MEDPIAVLLKFAFIAVLYLFLLWVARSALKDLRRADSRGSGLTAISVGRARLVVQRGGGLNIGTIFSVDGSKTIGRASDTDIPIEDQFASGKHARVFESDGGYFLEDLGSTNGTFLNGQRVGSTERLREDDRIRIGDTEFRYELQER
jgi:pSer/pThr/pTyr-binding forkhead associated (FHA) protein